MTGTQSILEAVGLRRVAEDETVLLVDVSLAMAPGSSTAIVGPPGAGKSLLVRTLGLLDPLQSGEIRFRDRPVADHDVPHVRRQVILVPQRPVLIEGSVRENLLLPYQFGRQANQVFDEERILRHLMSLGRDSTLLNRDARDLSGGESQLVAILRAIQLDPIVLLLDEPTSSLDAETTSAVERLIRQWQSSDEERALVVVTHTIEQAARLAQRTFHMERGSIISKKEHAGEPA